MGLLPDNPERTTRPELDRKEPAKLFTYAREKQAWIRKNLANQKVPDEIDRLADELKKYIEHSFDVMPELAITAVDIQHTKEVHDIAPNYMIEVEPLPYEGDAAVLGEYAIKATLLKFYREEETSSLRLYASTGEDPQNLRGGIYTPLLSIDVDSFDIQLAEVAKVTLAKKLEDMGADIIAELKNHDGIIRQLTIEIIQRVNESRVSTASKLHGISDVISQISRHTGVTQQFVDKLIDYIHLKLKLNMPHDIYTSANRVEMNGELITWHEERQETRLFENVTPQLGLVGLPAAGLGLIFTSDDEALRVPVQYITGMELSGEVS